ncbi:epimerase [Gymnodinialimonas hymeniacidonis]|uniref:epimerase n=1 Tax=Gymnodinialimonas hymeniacidonis TaxID=3126508 RepID=UPI0034C65A16
MPKTALILGANGRFGRHITTALTRHGWHTKLFKRATDTLPDAAIGADLIVNAWNIPYARWVAEIPAQTEAVISAAKASGAAVLIPGNIYVYGADLPATLTAHTPHKATNPLGQIRREMEGTYRKAGVKTVILRAGDYIDTEASGNWFDRIIAAKIRKGRFTYPGPLDQPHLWGYLPDLAEAGASLADRLDELPHFTDVLHEGFTLTGAELAQAIERATGTTLRQSQMAWWPIQLVRPFWSEAKHIVEMRYLWQRPHSAECAAALSTQNATPLEEALRTACAPLLQKSTSTQTSRWSVA